MGGGEDRRRDRGRTDALGLRQQGDRKGRECQGRQCPPPTSFNPQGQFRGQISEHLLKMA